MRHASDTTPSADPSPRRDEVAQLLADLQQGRAGAEADLLPLLYEELRDQAHRQLRGERRGHTLQTTALVHEAWLRLRGRQRGWESEAHFLRVAVQAMRRVLIDHARRKGAERRGGAWRRGPLDEVTAALEAVSSDLLAVHEALEALALLDARMAQIVELRFFGGLSIAETARVLGVSAGTVKSDWVLARAWLKERLGTP